MGASLPKAAGPRAVLHALQLRSLHRALPFQPPSPPTPPWEPDALHGCPAPRTNRGFSASGEGGRCLETTEKAAASSWVKPALGWEPNHTPPSHPTSLLFIQGVLAATPGAPSIPKSLFLQASPFPQRGGECCPIPIVARWGGFTGRLRVRACNVWLITERRSAGR